MTPVASSATPPSGRKTNIKRTQEQSAFVGKTLSSALCEDLAKERYTDAVVYSKEGTYLNLHKAILMTCPKIKSIIKPDLCCGGRCCCNQNLEIALVFPDVNERILRQAFEFIYTGTLRCQDNDKATISEFLLKVLGVPIHLPVRASEPLKFPCLITAGCAQVFEAERLFQHIDEVHLGELIKKAESTRNESCFHCAICKKVVKVDGGQDDIVRHFDVHREEIKSMVQQKTGYVPPRNPKCSNDSSTVIRQVPCSSTSPTPLDSTAQPSPCATVTTSGINIKLTLPSSSPSSSLSSTASEVSRKVAPLIIKVGNLSTGNPRLQVSPASESQIDAERGEKKRSSNETKPMKKSTSKRRRASDVNGDSSQEDEGAEERQTTEKKKRKKRKKRILSRAIVPSGSQSDDDVDSDGPLESERKAKRVPRPPSISHIASGIASRAESVSDGRTCSTCHVVVATEQLTLHAASHRASQWADECVALADGRLACKRLGCDAAFATRSEVGMHVAVDHERLVDELRKRGETLEDLFDPVEKDVGKETLQAVISDTDTTDNEEATPLAKSSATRRADDNKSKRNSSEENVDPNAMTDVEDM